MKEYVIPYRTVHADEPPPDEWKLIHCGFPVYETGGWGYYNPARKFTVWLLDVCNLLGFPLQQQYSRDQLEQLEEMLRPPLEERREKLRAYVATLKWDGKLSIPLVRRAYPPLRAVFADNSIKDALP